MDELNPLDFDCQRHPNWDGTDWCFGSPIDAWECQCASGEWGAVRVQCECGWKGEGIYTAIEEG